LSKTVKLDEIHFKASDGGADQANLKLI